MCKSQKSQDLSSTGGLQLCPHCDTTQGEYVGSGTRTPCPAGRRPGTERIAEPALRVVEGEVSLTSWLCMALLSYRCYS